MQLTTETIIIIIIIIMLLDIILPQWEGVPPVLCTQLSSALGWTCCGAEAAPEPGLLQSVFPVGEHTMGFYSSQFACLPFSLENASFRVF